MYCVLADIHGNLEALEAVLTAAREAGAGRFLSLGDTVGYGPDPNACTRLVRERCDAALAGNHDLAAVGREDIGWFNEVASAAIHWTAAELEPDLATYLDSLPSELTRDSLLLAHGSPLDPVREYVTDAWSASMNFRDRQFDLCFVGHAHYPLVFSLDRCGEDPGEVQLGEPGGGAVIDLLPGSRYIINPGAVGQPRDGNPQAAFALYDPGARRVEFRRVSYPLEVTQEKIRQAGLPLQLAERLSRGT